MMDKEAVCIDNIGMEDEFTVGVSYIIKDHPDKKMWYAIDRYGELQKCYKDRFSIKKGEDTSSVKTAKGDVSYFYHKEIIAEIDTKKNLFNKPMDRGRQLILEKISHAVANNEVWFSEGVKSNDLVEAFELCQKNRIRMFRIY
jgi:hypothetical protein